MYLLQNKTPTVQPDINLVPTLPATPHTPARARRAHDHRQPRGLGRVLEPHYSPVPIIAPPLDHVSRLPLSGEANAKIRLERLLERERRAREVDGLGDRSVGVRHSMGNEEHYVSEVCADEGTDNDDEDDGDGAPHSHEDWELFLGVGESLRREVIQWIMEVGEFLLCLRILN